MEEIIHTYESLPPEEGGIMSTGKAQEMYEAYLSHNSPDQVLKHFGGTINSAKRMADQLIATDGKTMSTGVFIEFVGRINMVNGGKAAFEAAGIDFEDQYGAQIEALRNKMVTISKFNTYEADVMEKAMESLSPLASYLLGRRVSDPVTYVKEREKVITEALKIDPAIIDKARIATESQTAPERSDIDSKTAADLAKGGTVQQNGTVFDNKALLIGAAALAAGIFIFNR